MKTKLFPLVAALALTALCAGAHAQPMQSPFVPSDEAQGVALGSESWIEIYDVPVSERANARVLLETTEGAPPMLAMSSAGALFYKDATGEKAMNASSTRITRDGKVIAYDDDCKVAPKEGDVLDLAFKSSRTKVTFKGAVSGVYALGRPDALADFEVRLPEGPTPQNCGRIVNLHVLYEGSLSVVEKGKPVWIRPVMAQVLK